MRAQADVSRYRWWSILLVVFVVACGKDSNEPTGPSPDRSWSEVELPPGLDDTVLTSIVFGGGRGIALAVRFDPVTADATSSTVLALASAKREPGWEVVEAAASISGYLSDAVVLPSGFVVAVGFDATLGRPMSVDEDQGWIPHTESEVTGGFLLAALGPGGRIHAVGVGAGDALAAIDCGANCWEFVATSFPGNPQEKAFTDLSLGDGVLYACGFDDGGDGSPEEPYRVLLENDGSGWTLVDSPCGGCAGYSFEAVGAASNDRVIVGGSLLDFSPDSQDQYTAWASMRQEDGTWVELDLPDAGSLDQVNDILVTSDGTINLLCGMDFAVLVRIGPAGGTESELIGQDHRLRRLTEGPGGFLYAAGHTGPNERPAPHLAVRAP